MTEHILAGQLDNTRNSGEDYHGLPVVAGLARMCRRAIVRAAPTCTLWVPVLDADVLRFRFNKRWVITQREIMEIGR